MRDLLVMYVQSKPNTYNYNDLVPPVLQHYDFFRETRAPIVGDTNDPNVAAVFGTSGGGPGVWGYNKRNDPNASGVLGISDNGVGVWGKGGRLAGFFEGSVHAITSGDFPTVWGENKRNDPNASGVLGTSERGVGVWGKGGRLAGFFEGNVDIIGSLTVQGRNINERMQALEGLTGSLQQQVSNLQQQLVNLQQKHEQDVAGIANSLITLAQRVSALGG